MIQYIRSKRNGGGCFRHLVDKGVSVMNSLGTGQFLLHFEVRKLHNYCPVPKLYWDVISVDGAMFNRARKVLLEAETKYMQ